MSDGNLIFDVDVNMSQAERQIQNFERRPIKLQLNGNDGFKSISQEAQNFSRTLEHAQSRMLAFGSAALILATVTNAIKEMAAQSIFVEKTLVDVNTILNTSSSSLTEFGNGLFDIAKKTNTSFGEVAKGAQEFARQGLSVEETLKRTHSAFVLSQRSGMSAAESTKAITTAMYAFNEQGLTHQQIVNKMAAVDVAFAVSSDDLSKAIERVSAVAQDAKVNFDQLLAVVTAAQQMTGRGGSNIANALSTVFTRTSRSGVLDDLENLGIAIRDVGGETLPVMQILSEFAKKYDTLSASQRSHYGELLGGVRNLNILKSTLKDLSKENSYYAQALKVSQNAENEAFAASEKMNTTMAARLNRLKETSKQAAAFTGDSLLGGGKTGLLGTALDTATPVLEFTSRYLNPNAAKAKNEDGSENGDAQGAQFAQGLVRGIGNSLSGPGLVMLTAAITKVTMVLGKSAFSVFQALEQSVKMGGEVAQRQLVINEALAMNPQLVEQIISKEKTQLEVGQAILANLERQAQLRTFIASMATNMSQQTIVAEKAVKNRASGSIPDGYINAEIEGAKQAGYSINKGDVRIMRTRVDGEDSNVIYNAKEKVIRNYGGGRDTAFIPPIRNFAGGSDAYWDKFENAENPANPTGRPRDSRGRFVKMENDSNPTNQPRNAQGRFASKEEILNGKILEEKVQQESLLKVSIAELNAQAGSNKKLSQISLKIVADADAFSKLNGPALQSIAKTNQEYKTQAKSVIQARILESKRPVAGIPSLTNNQSLNGSDTSSSAIQSRNQNARAATTLDGNLQKAFSDSARTRDIAIAETKILDFRLQQAFKMPEIINSLNEEAALGKQLNKENLEAVAHAKQLNRLSDPALKQVSRGGFGRVSTDARYILSDNATSRREQMMTRAADDALFEKAASEKQRNEIAAQAKIESDEQASRSKWGTRAMMGSFVAPMVMSAGASMAFPDTQDPEQSRKRRMTEGFGSAIGTGGMLGMMIGGPLGAFVGGAVGIGMGAKSYMDNSKISPDDVNAVYKEKSAKENEKLTAVEKALQARREIRESMAEGAKGDKLNQLRADYNANIELSGGYSSIILGKTDEDASKSLSEARLKKAKDDKRASETLTLQKLNTKTAAFPLQLLGNKETSWDESAQKWKNDGYGDTAKSIVSGAISPKISSSDLGVSIDKISGLKMTEEELNKEADARVLKKYGQNSNAGYGTFKTQEKDSIIQERLTELSSQLIKGGVDYGTAGRITEGATTLTGLNRVADSSVGGISKARLDRLFKDQDDLNLKKGELMRPIQLENEAVNRDLGSQRLINQTRLSQSNATKEKLDQSNTELSAPYQSDVTRLYSTSDFQKRKIDADKKSVFSEVGSDIKNFASNIKLPSVKDLESTNKLNAITKAIQEKEGVGVNPKDDLAALKDLLSSDKFKDSKETNDLLKQIADIESGAETKIGVANEKATGALAQINVSLNAGFAKLKIESSKSLWGGSSNATGLQDTSVSNKGFASSQEIISKRNNVDVQRDRRAAIEGTPLLLDKKRLANQFQEEDAQDWFKKAAGIKDDFKEHRVVNNDDIKIKEAKVSDIREELIKNMGDSATYAEKDLIRSGDYGQGIRSLQEFKNNNKGDNGAVSFADDKIRQLLEAQSKESPLNSEIARDKSNLTKNTNDLAKAEQFGTVLSARGSLRNDTNTYLSGLQIGKDFRGGDAMLGEGSKFQRDISFAFENQNFGQIRDIINSKKYRDGMTNAGREKSDDYLSRLGGAQQAMGRSVESYQLSALEVTKNSGYNSNQTANSEISTREKSTVSTPKTEEVNKKAIEDSQKIDAQLATMKDAIEKLVSGGVKVSQDVNIMVEVGQEAAMNGLFSPQVVEQFTAIVKSELDKRSKDIQVNSVPTPGL